MHIKHGSVWLLLAVVWATTAAADDPRASGNKGYAVGCSAATALGVPACAEKPSGRNLVDDRRPTGNVGGLGEGRSGTNDNSGSNPYELRGGNRSPDTGAARSGFGAFQGPPSGFGAFQSPPNVFDRDNHARSPR